MAAHFIITLALGVTVQHPPATQGGSQLSDSHVYELIIPSHCLKRSFLYQHHNSVARNAPVFAEAVHLFMRLGLQQPSRGHKVVPKTHRQALQELPM